MFRLTTSSETISKSIARKADSGANQQFESSYSGSLDVNVTYDDGGQGIIKGQYNYQTDKYFTVSCYQVIVRGFTSAIASQRTRRIE